MLPTLYTIRFRLSIKIRLAYAKKTPCRSREFISLINIVKRLVDVLHLLVGGGDGLRAVLELLRKFS